jgi:PadR family transcriptional regulator, regulatory protein PadR
MEGQTKNESSLLEEQELPQISSLEEDILTLLQGNELYGRQIIQEIEDSYKSTPIAGEAPKAGSLYPTLRRLEKNKKYIESRWDIGDNEEEGPRKRFYKLTEIGDKVLFHLQERRKLLMDRKLSENN